MQQNVEEAKVLPLNRLALTAAISILHIQWELILTEMPRRMAF